MFLVLHASRLCEYCLGASLAESNQSDGGTFPYETRGMLDIGDAISEAFPWPTLLPVRHRCPPPSGGGFDSFTITASWLRLTDMATILSMEAL